MSDGTGVDPVDVTRDEEVARFNRWADNYDQSFFQRLFFEPMHRFTVEQAASGRSLPATVLDVGCGTGQLLRQAVQLLPSAQLTGVDAAEEMLLVARSGAPRGAPLRFVHGFAEQMPFADHSFDLVVSTLSFHHWFDQQQGLREVRRLLSPGGTFALVDPLAVGLVRGLLMRSHHGRFHRPEALREMLLGAGLDVERFAPVPRSAGVLQVVLSHPAPEPEPVRVRRTRRAEASPELVPRL